MPPSTPPSDPDFLLRAAGLYDPARGLRNQKELFVRSWAKLSPQDRQQALALWRSDRSAAGVAGTADGTGAAADPDAAADSSFLVRAATVLDPATALPNQNAVFRLVWSRISPADQETLQTLWRQDDPQPSPPASGGTAIPAAALALIQEFEGYGRALADGRAEAYPDPIAGWQVPTIGFGTTRYPDGRAVRQGDVISRDQASAYLGDALNRHCRPALERIPTWERMAANQRSALYSFAYNLGAGFYGGADFASITRVCDSPDRWSDRTWVTEQFIKYRNPGSAAEAGLKRRRQAEADLFCRP